MAKSGAMQPVYLLLTHSR